MASTTFPVAGWSEVAYIDAQTALGTQAFPVAADAVRVESLDMGPTETKSTRTVKDKTLGRDQTNIDWTHGFIAPIPWKMKLSVFGSGAAGTVMQGLTNLFRKSAGFVETIVGGTRVDYTIAGSTNAASNPASLLGCTITRGDRDQTYAEQGVDAILKTMKLVWGEQDTYLELDGAFSGKSVCGYSTVAAMLIGDLTLTLQTITEAYRFVGGSLTTYGNTPNAGFDFYAMIESEVIRVTAINYTTGVFTIVRAQAGTVAAAHSGGKAITPYLPAATYPTGIPLSETDGTISPDGGSTFFNILKGFFNVKTGIDFGPSLYGQIRKTIAKADRIEADGEIDFVFDSTGEMQLGRANQFTNLNVLITNGAVAGSKLKIALPIAQIEPFATPFQKNDVNQAKAKIRARGNTGQDTFTFTNL